MSTRSHIGILNDDGTVESVYCHFDGYVQGGVGERLLFYQTEAQVRKLLSYGQIRNLGRSVGASEFYCRDRGDSPVDTKTEIFPSVEAWKGLLGATDHLYLFRPKDCTWLHNGEKPVLDILNEPDE